MVEYVKVLDDVDISELEKEITADAGIAPEITSSSWNSPDDLHLFFDAALSGAEETTLDGLITDHLDWSGIRNTREPLVHEAVEILDRHRNQTDYSQTKTITDTIAQDWADYLKDLRNVVLVDFATPAVVVWPTKPT